MLIICVGDAIAVYAYGTSAIVAHNGNVEHVHGEVVSDDGAFTVALSWLDRAVQNEASFHYERVSSEAVARACVDADRARYAHLRAVAKIQRTIDAQEATARGATREPSTVRSTEGT